MKKALCAGVLAWLAFAPVARADDDEVQSASSRSDSSDDGAAQVAVEYNTDRGPDDFGPTSQGDSDGPAQDTPSSVTPDNMGGDSGGSSGE